MLVNIQKYDTINGSIMEIEVVRHFNIAKGTEDFQAFTFGLSQTCSRRHHGCLES